MIVTAVARPRPSLRLLGLARDLALGGLLCATPVTSVIVLGWLTRRMARAARPGAGLPPPGWMLGPRGAGAVVRLAGGLGANFRAGVVTLAGLSAWTLPFTLVLAGAWWAGWENSFNKGYEQAWVGPTVWLAAAILLAGVLAHLPMALAHAAAEGRLGAFADLARIRALTAASGWRAPALATLSFALGLPMLGFRAAPTFIGQVVPEFFDLPPDTQAAVAGRLSLVAGVCAFAALWALREVAARHYRRAASRLAEGPPSRLGGLAGTLLAGLVWFGVVMQLLVAQFLNHAPALWLTHPLFLLPWPG